MMESNPLVWLLSLKLPLLIEKARPAATTEDHADLLSSLERVAQDCAVTFEEEKAKRAARRPT